MMMKTALDFVSKFYSKGKEICKKKKKQVVYQRQLLDVGNRRRGPTFLLQFKTQAMSQKLVLWNYEDYAFCFWIY